MIRLKRLLIEIGMSREAFALQAGGSGHTAGRVLSNDDMPERSGCRARLRETYEGWVERTPAAMAWLESRGLGISAIWDRCEAEIRENNGGDPSATLTGDPLNIEKREDIEMITVRAQRHFKLFRNPFLNDVSGHRDIYLSEEHRFLKEMMLDAAGYGGFVAVVGGVGSGKSVMRKTVAKKLTDDGFKVVYPLIIDKTQVTPSSLIDAIVMDISDESPGHTLERKTRQAVRLLKARADNGLRQVLMIEEAHLLDKRAFKALKQIHEFENGFTKLIGIILIGQPELLKTLNEVGNADIREVIRRVTTAEIQGLGKDVQPYLALKLSRVGKKAGDILAGDDVYEAINRRLERVSGGKRINRSYPLSVNNLVARAMNMAARMGEERVTADLILSC